MAGRMTLILGGARSGKSRRAEELASEVGGDVLYVATAEAGDEEMRARIAEHRASRPDRWRTVEAPMEVAAAIVSLGEAPDVIILDCVTLLANNLFGPEAVDDPAARRGGEAALERELAELLAAFEGMDSHWIVVSNEVGLGLVPANPLGRVYRDALGRANQRLAAAASEVLLMVAGVPVVVKSEATTD